MNAEIIIIGLLLGLIIFILGFCLGSVARETAMAGQASRGYVEIDGIIYKTEKVSQAVFDLTNGQGVDAVFEHVGEESWLHSLRVLKKGGKIVTCGATTGAYVRLDLRHLFIKHQQIIGSTMGNRKDLAEICDLISEGNIKPIISHTYDYNEIQIAHQQLEANQQMGKIVIKF